SSVEGVRGGSGILFIGAKLAFKSKTGVLNKETCMEANCQLAEGGLAG
ncbi:hypothetical protein CCACVL1_23997, partial [Corchorus capsularis]